MEKVELPLEVYKAFEGIKRTWGKLVVEEEINLLLLQIIHISSENTGDSITLRNFALKHPTKYIQALANGYKLEAESKLVLDVSHRLNEWMSRSYQGSEEQDRLNFAEEITEFIKGELVTQ